MSDVIGAMKVVVCVVVFFAICVGCFYLVELRHDTSLRNINEALQIEAAEAEAAWEYEKHTISNTLLRLFPEDSETIRKVLYPPPEEEEGEEGEEGEQSDSKEL